MILAHRKKHSLSISNPVVGACSGTHSLTIDITHEIDAGKKIQYSFDDDVWLDIGLPTGNPWTGVVFAGRPCDGEDHTLYIREEGTPTNTAQVTYSAPLGADFVTFRTGILETVVSECVAGVYSIKIYLDYALTSGDLEWDIDGGGYTSYTPNPSPDIEIIGPFSCDGATGKTLTVRSVDSPAVLDTWVFNAPQAACTLSLTDLTTTVVTGGTFSLDIETTFTNVSGDLEYKIDTGSWVSYTPGASPDTKTITGLVADGLVHDIEVRVVASPTTCTASGNYTAPATCVVNLMKINPRENAMNSYAILIQYEITDVLGDLEWSLDGGGYTAFTPASSTGIFDYSILGLIPDGVSHTFVLRSVDVPTCTDSIIFTSPIGCSAAAARDNDVWKAAYTGSGHLGNWDVDDGIVEQQSPQFQDYRVYYYNSSSMIANCPTYKENTLDVAEAALPAGLSAMEVDSWFGVRLRITGSVYSELSTRFTVRVVPFTSGTPLGSAEIAAYKAVETISATPTTITYLGDTVNSGALSLDSDSNLNPLPNVLNYLSFYLDDSYTNKDLYYYFRVCSTDADAGQFYLEFFIEDELFTI